MAWGGLGLDHRGMAVVFEAAGYSLLGPLALNIQAPDVTIAVRMDRSNREVLDYYLLPRLDMSVPRLRLAEHNGVSLDSYRFETLEPLFGMAARTKLLEVA